MHSVKLFKNYREQILWKEEMLVIMGISVKSIDSTEMAWVLDSDDFITGDGETWEQAEVDLLGKLGCM